jgi:hypothetical protein
MPKNRTQVVLNVLTELGTLEKATRLAEVLSKIHGHRVTRPYAVDQAITDALNRAVAKVANREEKASE